MQITSADQEHGAAGGQHGVVGAGVEQTKHQVNDLEGDRRDDRRPHHRHADRLGLDQHLVEHADAAHRGGDRVETLNTLLTGYSAVL